MSQSSQGQPSRVSVFISYSHKDEEYARQLRTHLAGLEQSRAIMVEDNARTIAGEPWDDRTRRALDAADLVLVLISPDYLASSYLYEYEMRLALERQRSGLARLVPIVLRPTAWSDTPLAQLQALPASGRPISDWDDLDAAFVEVVSGIRVAVDEIRSPAFQLEVAPRALRPLYEVFKASGVPTVTFVHRDDFDRLALALAQPGRGVVIEGPSGVGKTTALKQLAPFVHVLSARKPQDLERIQKLPLQHDGAVAVDDFHRLPAEVADGVVDHLKYLADFEPDDKKLVVIGIPRTGRRLVDLSFDLATRIDVFRLGRVTPEIVSRMVELGERALNIRFARRAEIVRAAAGSLNIAQLLCFNLCAANGVTTTQETTRKITGDLDDAIQRAMGQISLKFGDLIAFFARLGDRRDQTSVELLKALAESDDGFLSLVTLMDERPQLRNQVRQFVERNIIAELYARVPSAHHHLLYDERVPALIIDDPQLTFYLRQTPTRRLIQMAGKSETPARTRVFISYSHADGEWLQRLRVHLKPLERDGIIDVWDDTRIRGGSRWRQEIRSAIDAAKIAVLLVSADFLASDFVAQNELPPLLAAAETDGLIVLPVIISASRYPDSALAEFQAVNSPSTPLARLSRSRREDVLARVATTIEEALTA